LGQVPLHPTINGVLSYLLEGKTLHLFDIIATKIPSIDVILDHMPTEIDEIYFYFSPDLLTSAATAEPLSCGISKSRVLQSSSNETPDS
jgi:hypothetical protein